MQKKPTRNGYRYVLFGAGRQGTAAAYDLVKHCQAASVRMVEPDRQRGAASLRRLRKLLGKSAAVLQQSTRASERDLRDADVILSCAPYQANVTLTKLALRAGVAFCDLGGNPAVVAAQEKLTARKSVSVVPDCGVSPGLSNILAVHCARAHQADLVEVRCGGLPLVPPDARVNPLRYKLLFSPWGLVSEYSGRVPVIRNGRAASIAALSVTEEFDGEHESSPTSNNSPQVVEHLLRSGVRDYNYMTVRYKGHWPLVEGWKSLGFLQGNHARDAELVRQLESDPVLAYHPGKDRDKLILRVRGTRRARNLRRSFEYRFDVAADRNTRFAAMELMTAWGITIVAHHMASGRGRPNAFATPERFVDTAWVLAELERRLKTLR